MTVVAVSVIRDEADIVEQTVGCMVGQVDRVIVADNGSTDGTRQILEQLGVDVRDDPEPGHYQSRKLSALAAEAAAQGASWIVPFDADEIWYGRGGTVKRTLEQLPYWMLVCEAALYDHVPTAVDNGAAGIEALRWRRPVPAPLPKVAVRAVEGLVIHDGNHGATFPGEHRPPIVKHLLTVHHFPLRSAEQMVRKARVGGAALAVTDLPEDVGAHWRGWAQLSDEQLGEVFREHYWSADPERDGLVEDPVRR